MNNLIPELAATFSQASKEELRMRLRSNTALPSTVELQKLMNLLRRLFFPEFFDYQSASESNRVYHNGVDLESVYTILCEQISRGLVFCCEKKETEVEILAKDLAQQFMRQMPDIKRLVLTDIEAIALRDPAVNNYGEVVFSYPAITVMLHHRTAHALYKLGVPIIPRIIAEQAHSLTGIDIHPAATIGEYFAIDHGTGIVIGQTTIIGNHVMLYQGVTLGAKGFEYDSNGNPIDWPRHPIIEDRVTIYSNASILGRITIGHDSVIGGNVWVTQNIPPHSRILQSKPIKELELSDGAGI